MTRPLPPSPERRYPLVLGLLDLPCSRPCGPKATEHQLVYERGVVRAWCFGCGFRNGYAVSLHEASDWLRLQAGVSA